MNEGNMAPLCMAAPLLVLLVIIEVRWNTRKRKWIKSEGEMLGVDPDPDSMCPVIVYEFEGEQREQICAFNLSNPEVGESVPIVINPQSGVIYVRSFKGRWSLSLFLLGCILALTLLSILSK